MIKINKTLELGKVKDGDVTLEFPGIVEEDRFLTIKGVCGCTSIELLVPNENKLTKVIRPWISLGKKGDVKKGDFKIVGKLSSQGKGKDISKTIKIIQKGEEDILLTFNVHTL